MNKGVIAALANAAITPLFISLLPHKYHRRYFFVIDNHLNGRLSAP